jgi:class 3 adenylate cyclase
MQSVVPEAESHRDVPPPQEAFKHEVSRSDSAKKAQAPPKKLTDSLARCSMWICRRWAASPTFSALTTILTIYALFGDDIRLVFTKRTADPLFDAITIACMVIFGLEIVVCSVGKVGYIFGFFFWLDAISTITLLLDITYISEDLFGDSLSKEGENTGGGNSGAADSAEASRAARMSRAGTKAGRVVRLIRLMRLLRLFKAFKKTSTHYQAPGEDWESIGQSEEVEKESAVSKKLSEMTTRRVIGLVLTIMLILPLFSPQLWRADLASSAQYGANILFRRLWDDMVHFGLQDSIVREQEYFNSKWRAVYEDDFLMYVYYHNWFCDADEVPSDKPNPLSSFSRLFWLGGAPASANMTRYFLPNARNHDWDARWNGKSWNYYQCNFPPKARSLLTMPWNETTSCLNGRYRGVSLAAFRESSIDCPEKLRWQERSIVHPTAVTDQESQEFRPLFVFDRRDGSAMEAMLNSGQTLFICLLLGVGAMTFSNDANKLVLMPIEKIIAKLEKIRKNPLEAMTIGDEEHHREQVRAEKKKLVMNTTDHMALLQDLQSGRGRLKRLVMKLSWFLPSRRDQKQNVQEPMETVVLEKTIIKIGSLLALGFGEAGAEIIGQNMQGSDTSAVNAMIPGRRVEALFGFCDIRNFTDATEVLQDQVMLFVNRIAGVVHSCINEFFGSPNKNVGDAFLLVWRLTGQHPRKQQRLADMSLISFVKIIATINRSPLLAEYRSHPKLVKRLPNYRVRLGFGLHSGWAIEGAIGSEFKIDASYLSPNVNMAARLEGVTKQYGCLILISDSLVKLCSEPIAQECRLIDHVAMSGRKGDFELFTMDLDDLALEVDRQLDKEPVGRAAKYKAKNERLRKKNERWSEDFNLYEFFANDRDIKIMRHKFTTEFFCRFNMAYLNYEAGNWSVAKSMFEATRFLLATEDGPSAALLRYMKQHSTSDGCAPKGWLGYRVLNDR